MNIRNVAGVICLSFFFLAATSEDVTDHNDGDAGKGFTYRSVSFKDADYGDIWVMGEIENQSGSDYSMVGFDVTIYDAEEKVIGVGLIMIMNIKKNGKRPFKESVADVKMKMIDSFKVDFNTGMK